MKTLHLHGQKFGLWTVTDPKVGKVTDKYLCRCQCGTERPVVANNLIRGGSNSCGCNRRHPVVHGHGRKGQRTPTYRAWKAMLSRVKPEYKQARNYFDRGISVSPLWSSSYVAFLKDMGERPADKTLDRINNDGPYAPGNCRWADARTQRRNSSRVSWVVYEGRKLTVQDAAEQIGVNPSAIWQDKRRRGGTAQEAVDRVASRRSVCTRQ